MARIQYEQDRFEVVNPTRFTTSASRIEFVGEADVLALSAEQR